MEKRSIIFLIITIFILGVIGLFFYDRIFLPEVTDPLLLKIKERGEIVIGTDATYPPMESIDENGNFIGMDIDIAKEIASDLNVRAVFKKIVWDEIFDSVREGEVDMIISSITITPERGEIMSFSVPYFNAGQVVVIKTDKEGMIKGVGDLQEYTVGVQKETTSEQEAKKYVGDPSLVKGYEDYDLAKKDLLAGEIDAIIIDYPAAIGMVVGEEDLKIVGEPFTQEFYGAAVQKGQKALVSQIDKTIRRLRGEGEFKKLEEKWLNQ